jgi:SAM-dependent methyltransferase
MSDLPWLMYSDLADWFHLLSPPREYGEEAEEAKRLLEAYSDRSPSEVLELGTGGGNLASHLSGEWDMTLSDLSVGMLDLSKTINPTAHHVVGDMRTLRLGRTFDAVIIHDAIVYMNTEEDLGAAMETAFLHVRQGGAAIFLPDWVSDSYVPRTQHGGSDGGGRGLRYMEWDRDIEADGHTVVTDYILVTRDESGEVKTYHDAHTLGIFPSATWLRLLESVGFVSHQLTGAEGLEIFIGVRPSSPAEE